MSLINDEKRLFEWACKEQKPEITSTVLSPIDSVAQSYYEERNQEEELLHEYDFETAIEIKKQLEILWGDYPVMDDARMISVVSMMKGKPSTNEADLTDSEKAAMEKDFEIPAYVYVF